MLAGHHKVIGIDLAGRRRQGIPSLKHSCYLRVLLSEVLGFLGLLARCREVSIAHSGALDLEHNQVLPRSLTSVGSEEFCPPARVDRLRPDLLSEKRLERFRAHSWAKLDLV